MIVHGKCRISLGSRCSVLVSLFFQGDYSPRPHLIPPISAIFTLGMDE